MCANNTGTKPYAETSHEMPWLYIFVGGQVKELLKICSVTGPIWKPVQRMLHHHLEWICFREHEFRKHKWKKWGSPLGWYSVCFITRFMNTTHNCWSTHCLSLGWVYRMLQSLEKTGQLTKDSLMFIKINVGPLKVWQNEKYVATGNEELLELSRELKSVCVTSDVVRRKNSLV